MRAFLFLLAVPALFRTGPVDVVRRQELFRARHRIRAIQRTCQVCLSFLAFFTLSVLTACLFALMMVVVVAIRLADLFGILSTKPRRDRGGLASPPETPWKIDVVGKPATREYMVGEPVLVAVHDTGLSSLVAVFDTGVPAGPRVRRKRRETVTVAANKPAANTLDSLTNEELLGMARERKVKANKRWGRAALLKALGDK